MKECKYCFKDGLNSFDEVESILYKEHGGYCPVSTDVKLIGDRKAKIAVWVHLNGGILADESVPIHYCPMCGRKLD